MARRISNIVFDIHGVLVGRKSAEGEPRPGNVVELLRSHGVELRFLTNSSSMMREAIVKLLSSHGVMARPCEIYTSAMTMGHYINAVFNNASVYLVGSPALKIYIESACGSGLRWCGGADAEIVVVGRREVLDDATKDSVRMAGERGAALLATSCETSFPGPAALEKGPGATVRAVENLMGREALVIGKPNLYVLTDVMGFRGGDLKSTLIVGDSPLQDIAFGKNAGCPTALIAPLEDMPPSNASKADYVITSLGELLPIVAGEKVAQ